MAKNKEAIFDKLIQKTVPTEPKKSSKESIIILDELRDFIPPLSYDEFEMLKVNIIAEGCRDALVVWEQGNNWFLIDGHNRYQICTENGIEFKTEVKQFKDLEEVKDWMFYNQLGKRNLTEEAKSYLRGMQYKREKQKHGGTRKSSGQNVDLLKTSQKLAEAHKVSDRTIQRDEQYAEMIDLVAGADKDLKWNILNKQYILPKTLSSFVSTLSAEQLGVFRQTLKEKQTVKPSDILPKPLKATPQEIQTLQRGIVKALNELILKKDKSVATQIIDWVQELVRKLD